MNGSPMRAASVRRTGVSNRTWSGRSPRDALVIAPRICGICSTAHLYAAVCALEDAWGITPPSNAVHIRNISLMAEIIQSDLRQTFLLAGCTAAVLVDAWRGDAPAGRVSIQRAEESLQTGVRWTSSHAADLRFALRSAQAEWGALPPTCLVMVAVTTLQAFSIGLSPPVERAVPVAAATVARLLQNRAPHDRC